MPDSNAEQLAIEVLAKIGDLEKNMKRANALTAKAYSDMAKGSKSATRQMEADMLRSTTRINQAVALTAGKIGDVGKAFAGSLARNALAAGVALLSVAAIVGQTKQALEEFGDIADKSAQSGLDAEFFQELTYGASLAGVGMDDLSSALNTFNKNSGLAVVGKGKMVQALKALNPALLENIRNADSQAERVKLAADAINQAKTAAEKAAIATTLFGNSGAALVPVFNGGADAIERTAVKARELGIIVDNELISRADELGDEFDTASQVMDRQFKKTLIDLAPILISSAQLAGDLARGITAIIDSMRSIENQSLKTLETNQATNALQRLDMEQKIADLKQQEADGTISLMDRAELANQQAQYDLLKKQDVEMTKIIAKRNEAAEAIKQMNGAGSGDDGDGVLPPITPGGSTRNQAAEDAIRQAKAVQDLIDNLRLEQSLLGRSEIDQAKMKALRDAGAAATADQKTEIERLIVATAQEKAANEALMQSIELQRDIAKGALTDITTAFEDGKITAKEWADVVSNMIRKVSDAIINNLVNMAITPANGGFNLFGALLGLGGAVAGGGTGVGAGAVTKAAAPRLPSAARAAAQSAASVHVTVGASVKGDGSFRPFVEGVSDERIGRHVPGMIEGGVRAYTRHTLPGDVKKIIQRPKDHRLDR